MKIFHKMFFLGICLVVPFKSYAADDYKVSICKLQSNQTGHAYLNPCEGWSTKNYCPATGPWITWDITTEGGKSMYTTALAAFATGKNVVVRLDGTTCNNYDVTNMIRIQNI